MLNGLKSYFRDKLYSFLQLHPAQTPALSITESLRFETNIAVNRLWYRGDGYELNQAYRQLPSTLRTFWGSVPTTGLEIRKIHTGLPKTIVNMLTGLIVDDLQELTFEKSTDFELWQEMEKETAFKRLMRQAVEQVLVTGDGAFKISLDASVSPYPILEFFAADRIEPIYRRGALQEIVFRTDYRRNSKKYILLEHYGKGYVTYELTDVNGAQYDLSAIPETAGLQPITWDGDFMLCAYMRFYSSDKYEGRGQSIFDAKRDNFDALDEAWSQWVDALRQGRSRTYIPECLVPRDENGVLQRSNAFDNRFLIAGNDTSENAQNKITVEQPGIPHDSYLATYITALDLCLQGIISPSTLGIDTKKLDNAEAQREKEKTTLYTRQTIVTALQQTLPEVISACFGAYQTAHSLPLESPEVDIPFGEYANPSFESQVETIVKARQGGIMSIDAGIEELYGDSKSADWKAEEAAKIRAENGVNELDEPALGIDL